MDLDMEFHPCKQCIRHCIQSLHYLTKPAETDQILFIKEKRKCKRHGF